MKRVGAALLMLSITVTARGEDVLPGRTLVLDHGIDPGAASAMPGGSRHDGRLRYPLPRVEPSRQVLVPLSGASARGPTVGADGNIYVGSSEGLHVIAPDGSSVRTLRGDPLDTTPVLLPGGDLLAFARDGRFTRFASDGSPRAHGTMGLSVRFAPLVLADGSIALVGASRTLAHVGSDLIVRGTSELPDGLALPPTPTARGRWAIAAGAELVLVEPRTLEIARVIPLPGRAATPAAVASDGTLWVATVEGELVRIAGELRVTGTFPLGARLPEAIGSDRAMVVLAPGGDVLLAVPARGLLRLAADGTERWAASFDAPVFPALSVDEASNAAVLDHVGHLRVIDAAGATLWTMLLPGTPLGPPIATAQGRIVVVTERGVVVVG